MNRSIVGPMGALLLVTIVLISFASLVAGAATDVVVQDDQVKVDRERIAGTWRVVALEVNGNKASETDARKLSVINHADGTWSLSSDGKEVARGTSEIDPTQSPKTIDFVPSDASAPGSRYLGIYELGETTRRLCFAPLGKERPTEFSSTAGNQHLLVTFEREAR